MTRYQIKSYERCALTGMSIHRKCIYTTGRWISEHITLSTGALDEEPQAEVEDMSSNTGPLRHAK